MIPQVKKHYFSPDNTALVKHMKHASNPALIEKSKRFPTKIKSVYNFDLSVHTQHLVYNLRMSRN